MIRERLAGGGAPHTWRAELKQTCPSRFRFCPSDPGKILRRIGGELNRLGLEQSCSGIRTTAFYSLIWIIPLGLIKNGSPSRVEKTVFPAHRSRMGHRPFCEPSGGDEFVPLGIFVLPEGNSISQSGGPKEPVPTNVVREDSHQ